MVVAERVTRTQSQMCPDLCAASKLVVHQSDVQRRRAYEDFALGGVAHVDVCDELVELGDGRGVAFPVSADDRRPGGHSTCAGPTQQ